MSCLKRDACPIIINSRQEIASYEQKLSGLRRVLGHILSDPSDDLGFSVPLRTVDPDANEADMYYFSREQLDRDIMATETVLARGYAFLERLDLHCASTPLTMRAQVDNTAYTVTVCRSTAVPAEPGEPVHVSRRHIAP